MKGLKSVLLVGAVLFAGIAQAEVDVVSIGRCEGWGDSLDQGAPTEGRIAFSLKCEKNVITRSYIKKHAAGTHREGGGPVTKGYPTYGYFDPAADGFTNPNKWFAPTTESGNCADIPAGYQISHFCASGCYAPEQEVLFASGYESIQRADEQGMKSIMSLTSDSTLDEVKLKESERGEYLHEVKDGKQKLVNFKMASGGKLRVTLNHPLVTKEGKIRRAEEFKVGDFLVKVDGSLDPITERSSEEYFGKVYNVSVNSFDGKENIIVAQGYLNGSLYYQNEGVRHLNRELLRSSIAANFIH